MQFDRHSRPDPNSLPGASWVFGLEEAPSRGAFQGKIEYRVAGILWGGDTPAPGLLIRFDPGAAFGAVEDFSPPTNRTWTFRPRAPGRYSIELRVRGDAVPARRLAAGHYERTVEIGEV